MENEVPHTYYQENKAGSDFKLLWAIHRVNVTREILSRHRILAEKVKNIGIIRMTGEVTDRFNEITLFGMALFWQKQLNSLQNL